MAAAMESQGRAQDALRRYFQGLVASSVLCYSSHRPAVMLTPE